MKPQKPSIQGRERTIATVVVLVAAAAAVVLYMGEDQYTITYELNGGDNNSLNPTSYTSGDEIQLYDAYDDERVFVAWYLDEGLTQECDTIQSDMSGDITLYAGWSDTVVGKGLTFDVQGSYTSGLLSSLPHRNQHRDDVHLPRDVQADQLQRPLLER